RHPPGPDPGCARDDWSGAPVGAPGDPRRPLDAGSPGQPAAARSDPAPRTRLARERRAREWLLAPSPRRGPRRSWDPRAGAGAAQRTGRIAGDGLVGARDSAAA